MMSFLPWDRSSLATKTTSSQEPFEKLLQRHFVGEGIPASKHFHARVLTR